MRKIAKRAALAAWLCSALTLAQDYRATVLGRASPTPLAPGAVGERESH